MGSKFKIAIIAFLVRFFLVLINLYVITLPQGGKDAKKFERLAYETSLVEIHDVTSYFESGGRFMILVGSLIYKVLGRSELFLSLLMVILGTVTVINIYKAALLLWQDKRIAKSIGWFAAFFPQMALHSALYLREIPVNFFLTLAIIGIIKYWKYKKPSGIVQFIIYTFFGTLFHSGIIVGIAGVLISFLIIRQPGVAIWKQTISRIVGIFLLIIGLVYINNTGYGLNKFGGSLDAAFEEFEEREARETLGAAAFPEWMRIRNGTSDLYKIPIRMVAFLFSPAIPFMVRSSYHLLGLIDAVLYIFLFYRLYLFRKYISSNKSASIILIVSIALCLTFSLGVSNFGTAIRHRAKIAPLFMVLAVNRKTFIRQKQKEFLYRLRLQNA